MAWVDVPLSVSARTFTETTPSPAASFTEIPNGTWVTFSAARRPNPWRQFVGMSAFAQGDTADFLLTISEDRVLYIAEEAPWLRVQEVIENP